MNQTGDFINFLYSLRNRGSKYGLERMRAWAEVLGNPQERLAVVHVAGTNGKGSVCAMVESIFRAAGYKTGLFTSPHLVYLGERMQVNRTNIPEDRLLEILERLRASADESFAGKPPEEYPSFFEFITMAGFLYFAEEKVDVAVLETGLGGRLDATNVVTQPLVTCITSIALDHQEILGDTLAKIAREKAGIIKKNVPLVVGEVTPECLSVFEDVAQPLSVSIHSVEKDFPSRDYPETVLTGEVQQINAACAMRCAQLLATQFPRINAATIAEGLATVQWAGRWEVLSIDRLQVILDCTHNVGGVPGLCKNLESLGERPWICCGFVGEIRAQEILPVLCQYAAGLTILEINQPRATPAAQVRSLVSATFRGSLEIARPKQIFSLIAHARACGCTTLVVTGSIYLIGEIKAALADTASQDRLQG